MKLRLFPLLLGSLVSGSCLENEEELEVRPDGSLRVTVTAKGDLSDFTDGYPVPLDPRWKLVSADAERWVRELGADTGSAAVRRRLSEVDWSPEKPGRDDELELSVERAFASVDELPRGFADESDAYRSAYLQRSAALQIRSVGGRRVFVFERTFHGFDYGRFDVGTRMELPDELELKLKDERPLTAEERGLIAEKAVAAYEEVAVEFTRDALLGLYTEGDASLPARAVPAILEEARAATRVAVSSERLARVLDLVEQKGGEVGPALEALEADWRAGLRAALGTALAREGVAVPSRNAALYALEWEFTAFDHYSDLADEKFVVRVKLPGAIVGGNAEDVEEDTARWEFEGGELQGKDVVLRAVAVTE